MQLLKYLSTNVISGLHDKEYISENEKTMKKTICNEPSFLIRFMGADISATATHNFKKDDNLNSITYPFNP